MHHLTLHDSFLRIAYNLTIYCDVSDIFEHAQNVTTACDTLRLLESQPTESQRVSHYTTSCRRRRRWGPSRFVVSSKSCSVRPLLVAVLLKSYYCLITYEWILWFKFIVFLRVILIMKAALNVALCVEIIQFNKTIFCILWYAICIETTMVAQLLENHWSKVCWSNLSI